MYEASSALWVLHGVQEYLKVDYGAIPKGLKAVESGHSRYTTTSWAYGVQGLAIPHLDVLFLNSVH